MTPDLYRGRAGLGIPMVHMDARRAPDGLKGRRTKSDMADAWALAEMLEKPVILSCFDEDS